MAAPPIIPATTYGEHVTGLYSIVISAGDLQTTKPRMGWCSLPWDHELVGCTCNASSMTGITNPAQPTQIFLFRERQLPGITPPEWSSVSLLSEPMILEDDIVSIGKIALNNFIGRYDRIVISSVKTDASPTFTGIQVVLAMRRLN